MWHFTTLINHLCMYHNKGWITGISQRGLMKSYFVYLISRLSYLLIHYALYAFHSFFTALLSWTQIFNWRFQLIFHRVFVKADMIYSFQSHSNRGLGQVDFLIWFYFLSIWITAKVGGFVWFQLLSNRVITKADMLFRFLTVGILAINVLNGRSKKSLSLRLNYLRRISCMQFIISVLNTDQTTTFAGGAFSFSCI